VAYVNRLVLRGRKFHPEGLEGNGWKRRSPGKRGSRGREILEGEIVLGLKVWSDWLGKFSHGVAHGMI
jgi:hypothetical protein